MSPTWKLNLDHIFLCSVWNVIPKVPTSSLAPLYGRLSFETSRDVQMGDVQLLAFRGAPILSQNVSKTSLTQSCHSLE